jgi:uncharacterized protein
VALGPEPLADADTRPFWEAAREQRLLVQRCTSCERWIWQPRPLCPACHTPNPAWHEVTGAGHVVSWTVIHPPVLRAWEADVPFAVLLVELDEGVRMVGRLTEDDDFEDLAIGQRVTLRWRREGPTILPAWTPHTT